MKYEIDVWWRDTLATDVAGNTIYSKDAQTFTLEAEDSDTWNVVEDYEMGIVRFEILDAEDHPRENLTLRLPELRAFGVREIVEVTV